MERFAFSQYYDARQNCESTKCKTIRQASFNFNNILYHYLEEMYCLSIKKYRKIIKDVLRYLIFTLLQRLF